MIHITNEADPSALLRPDNNHAYFLPATMPDEVLAELRCRALQVQAGIDSFTVTERFAYEILRQSGLVAPPGAALVDEEEEV